MANSYKNLSVESGGGLFYRTKDGDNRIRLVSEAIPTFSIFDEDNQKSFRFMDKANADKKCAEMRLSTKGNPSDVKVTSKHALYLIDRESKGEDGGPVIQMAEFGPSIMNEVKNLANGVDSAFEELPEYDMVINRTGAKKDTRYSLRAARSNSALTETEKTAIKEFVAKNKEIRDFIRDNSEDGEQVAPF
jgi:hypothetical protein